MTVERSLIVEEHLHLGVNACVDSRSEPPARPARTARISPRIESAVSAGECAPRSSPAGPWIRSTPLPGRLPLATLAPPSCFLRCRSLRVERVGLEHPDDCRDVELLVVRKDDDRRRVIGPTRASTSSGQARSARPRWASAHASRTVPRVGRDRPPAERLPSRRAPRRFDRAEHEEARRRPKTSANTAPTICDRAVGMRAVGRVISRPRTRAAVRRIRGRCRRLRGGQPSCSYSSGFVLADEEEHQSRRRRGEAEPTSAWPSEKCSR